jgi:acyl-coenzyme A thioesterase PaaI-like protein
MADDEIIALQNVDDGDFWEKFAIVMGSPDGLLTYRYLNCRQDPVSLEGHMDLRRDMRNPAGGLMAAPLSIGMAEGRGDDTAVPAPVMGSVHILDDGRDVRSVVSLPMDGPNKTGRTLSFGAGGMIVDADERERVLAFTQGMGVKISDAPPGYEYIPPAPSGITDSPDLPPLHEAFGAQRNAGGYWELPELDLQHASTSGTLHHGATQVLLEHVAFELASDHAQTDALQIEDWTVMYTSAGRVGPFEASGRVIGPNARPQRHAAQVQLLDRGMGDRLVAVGTAVFRAST